MGFGLPAAMAAKINRPGQKVTALVVNGGFNMTMQDFSTAVKYSLPITVVIINNGSYATYAMEKNKMMVGNLTPKGTFLNNPDFAAYAESCGGLGVKVTGSGELHNALQEAFNSDRPAIVDVIVSDVAMPGTTMP